MNSSVNAWDFLSHGDAIRARAAQDRSTVAKVASEAGLSSSIAAKAAWLSGVFSPAIRSRLGRKTLVTLTPTHLEIVAKAREDIRDSLLRHAARDRLSARDLKALMRSRGVPSGPASTMAGLEESTRAMEIYAGFDDRSLSRLINGPNGAAVRRAATAGRLLDSRLSEFVTN